MSKMVQRILQALIIKYKDEKGTRGLWELIREINSRRDFEHKAFDKRCPRCFSRDLQQELASYKDTNDWLECEDCGLKDFTEVWKYWEHRNKNRKEEK